MSRVPPAKSILVGARASIRILFENSLAANLNVVTMKRNTTSSKELAHHNR